MSLKRFDPEDILISSEKVSVPVWSNKTDTLKKGDMFIHDVQEAGLAGRYYIDIYDTPEEDAFKSQVQFSIAYGNKYGSGSREFGTVEGASPSAVIWGQYRSLVLGDEEQDFVFGYGDVSGSYAADSIFIISLERARYKEALRPGTLELTFGDKVLTDNSRFVQSERYLDSGRVYELVEKTDDGVAYPSEFGSYGFLLPDIGVIILNAEALGEKGLNKVTGLNTSRITYDSPSGDGGNTRKLFEAIDSFVIQSEETVTSNYIFARARNAEFNYSTNPTNVDSTGELRHNVMINSPQAYITAIGLYNDANELLAVAKLSRPLVKDFNKEALIRIKLDY